MTNIVQNKTKGYGYNYSSLADIAAQGYEIPKMKVETDSTTQKDYVYYYDKDFKEWFRGSEIVIPDSKGMNKAQVYGSALTYARRYTVLMALQLACTDDQVIENLNKDGTQKGEKQKENKPQEKQKATLEQITELQLLLPQERLDNLLKSCKVNKLEELDYTLVSSIILKEKKAQDNA